jgi:hypothetical protein
LAVGRNFHLNPNSLPHLRPYPPDRLPICQERKIIHHKLSFLNLGHNSLITDPALSAEFDQRRQLILPVLLYLRFQQLAGIRIKSQPQPGRFPPSLNRIKRFARQTVGRNSQSEKAGKKQYNDSCHN